MAVTRAKKLEIVRRREQVADLYVQGWRQTAIAEKLGVAQSLVSLDLQGIRKVWRESTIRDFDEAREVELQKIDRLEREAWLAWERSQKPAQSADIQGNDALPSRKRIKNQYGDARFLAIVSQCIGQRRALLGLDILPQLPEQNSHAGLSVESRRERVVAILGAVSQRTRTGDPGEGSSVIEPRVLCHDDEPGPLADGLPLSLPRPSNPGVDG